jgi:hypothetical protein
MPVSPGATWSQPELPEMRDGLWFYLPGRAEGHWLRRKTRLMADKPQRWCSYEECYEEASYVVKPHLRTEPLLGGPMLYSCKGHVDAMVNAYCELLLEDSDLHAVTVTLP